MPREDIGIVPKEEVDLAIARLEAFAIHLKQVQKWFEANPDKELWVWRFKSLDRGIVALETLPAEFMRAIHAHSRNAPQGPESSKARQAKKAPTLKATESKLDDAKAKLRTSRKKKNG